MKPSVTGRDVAEQSRYGFAPSLSLGLGTPTRLTLAYLHESADDVPDYGIPYLGSQVVERAAAEFLRLQERLSEDRHRYRHPDRRA